MLSNELALNLNTSEYVLVSAPNQAGKQFISGLREKDIPYYAIVNNNYCKKRLEAMGVNNIITVDTIHEKTWRAPEIPIGNIFLFEDSFNLSCRYIQICKAWPHTQIYVVTRRDCARLTYRGLGADHLIYINNNDVSFLLQYV
jgi:hypothetical protein